MTKRGDVQGKEFAALANEQLEQLLETVARQKPGENAEVSCVFEVGAGFLFRLTIRSEGRVQ